MQTWCTKSTKKLDEMNPLWAGLKKFEKVQTWFTWYTKFSNLVYQVGSKFSACHIIYDETSSSYDIPFGLLDLLSLTNFWNKFHLIYDVYLSPSWAFRRFTWSTTNHIPLYNRSQGQTHSSMRRMFPLYCIFIPFLRHVPFLRTVETKTVIRRIWPAHSRQGQTHSSMRRMFQLYCIFIPFLRHATLLEDSGQKMLYAEYGQPIAYKARHTLLCAECSSYIVFLSLFLGMFPSWGLW